MKSLVLCVLPIAALLFTGCASTPGPTPVLLTPAAVTQEVAIGVSVGLDVYPQATMEVALARDVICAAATVTNANPTLIVADLANLNITNAESKLIVSAALLVYEGFTTSSGPTHRRRLSPTWWPCVQG